MRGSSVPPATGDTTCCGKRQPELLDDLEPVGLRAFGVVGPQVDVHEPPAEPIRHLRAQPVHIVVVAGDGENRRAEDRRAEHLAGLEVVGDEHAALQAEARGVRRRRCWPDCRSTRTPARRDPSSHGARRRHRHDAILVGQRRMVDRVVLDVQLAQAQALRQPRAADERREAGMEAGLRLAGNRQQLAVAPEVLRPRWRSRRESAGSRCSRRPARAGRGTCRTRRWPRRETSPCTDDTAVR